VSLRTRFAQACTILVVALVSCRAWADKVALLPFISVGNATSARLDEARAATRSAVTSLHHTLPSDAEMLTAQMSAKDGVADSSQEYRAAGRASSSDWTVVGHVEERGASYRLELEVCQVASGRIESVAREVDQAKAPAQIGEMLSLLLRPEGIGTTDIPWEHAAPPTPPVPPPTPPKPPTPAGPPPPPPPPAVRHVYAEGHPIGIGLGAVVLDALHRPSNAVGSGVAALGELVVGYAIDSVPGLEVRGNFAGAILGPGSITADAGARYALPLAPTARLFVGPEISLGGFFTTGADKSPRFLLHNAIFLSLGIGQQVQFEAAGDFEAAFGGAGSLLLGGGTLRGVVRF
jgi:hypothetical protein